tara:strand:+ start:568 stop:903 length:336 start_codon:yes stop_codon:yes gene_type:complete
MFSVRSFWGWFLLLSFALLAPVALPAGGASRNKDLLSNDASIGPMLAGSSCELRAYPSIAEPPLRTIQAGTPIRILRLWHDQDGVDWLHVQISSFRSLDQVPSVNRGWISV